jgi:hypothetical protein
VFGIFKNDGEPTKRWLRSQLNKYVKTDEIKIQFFGAFRGMIWATSHSVTYKDLVLLHPNWQSEGSGILAKPDLPIVERLENTVLFGITDLLHPWAYPRNCSWVDVPSNTISCGPELVAKMNQGYGVDNGIRVGVGFMGSFRARHTIKRLNRKSVPGII